MIKVLTFFSLKPELQQHLEKFCEWSQDFDAPLEIDTDNLEFPDDIMTCEKDGLNWIACARARKFKELDPSLGSKMKEIHDTSDYGTSKFANLMNPGSLYYPTKKWYNQVVKMYFFVFNHFHPAVCDILLFIFIQSIDKSEG